MYSLQTTENMFDAKYKDEKPHSATEHKKPHSIPANAQWRALMARPVPFISVVQIGCNRRMETNSEEF